MESNKKNLDFLPLSLQVLLKNTFPKNCSDVIISSIGQLLIQHSRPRTIFTPLQVGLAVQMHRQFGSRFSIDLLHRQGFNMSCDEVLNYERSAASSGMSLPLVISANDFFMQAIADNVDHNMQTIDAKNTFHGMGISGCYPKS